MILTIQGPKDSISTTIHKRDIVRVETCVLEFFGKKLFNLYIIIRAESDENFHLFSFVSIDRFKTAFAKLAETLKEGSPDIDTILIEPASQAEQISERGSLQPSV